MFAAQLHMLERLGRPPITVSEGVRMLSEGRPGHWVAMSFDDGYADNVTRAVPHLLAAAARATFYLTAGWMEDRRTPWWDRLAGLLEATPAERLTVEWGGQSLDLPLQSRRERAHALAALLPALAVVPAERDRRLEEIVSRLGVPDPVPCALATWEQADRLVEAGMEIGAHTLDHPLLSQLDPQSQRLEIAESIDLIERRLGVRATGLAYPGGDYDQITVAAARSAGLRYAVTTRPGTNVNGAPRFELRRRGLTEGACLDPAGRFSRHLASAELDGAFDRLRGECRP